MAAVKVVVAVVAIEVVKVVIKVAVIIDQIFLKLVPHTQSFTSINNIFTSD